MTVRRQPNPPTLPGYHYLEPLGSGGFSDVLLYQQELPRRNVAVKVLLDSDVTGEGRKLFLAEANLMAQLSTHPAIVTVYHADVTQDGRPFIVMEYCPRPNLGVRFRKERISVAEALRIGIQIAGAVETAHRAGILHRDIKPANILITDYNRPALADFGISVAMGAESAAADVAVGMSIPWAAPELFLDPPRGDARTDIYALAATLYSVLASRTPFEVRGGKNSAFDLVERIKGAMVPAVNRSDVPENLERLLAQAMSKDPDKRPASALDFGRALQRIEQELNLPITTIDVLEESAHPQGGQGANVEFLAPAGGFEPIEPTGGLDRLSSFAPGPLPLDAAWVRRFVIPEDSRSFSEEHSAAGTTRSGGESTGTIPTPPHLHGGKHDGTVIVPQEVEAPHKASQDFAPWNASAVSAPDVAPQPEDVHEDHPHKAPRARLASLIIVIVVFVVAGIVGVSIILGGALKKPGTGDDPPPPNTAVPQKNYIDPIQSGQGVANGNGNYTFTWQNPKGDPKDTYVWRWSEDTSAKHQADKPSVTADLPPGYTRACISVSVRNHSGVTSDEKEICAS